MLVPTQTETNKPGHKNISKGDFEDLKKKKKKLAQPLQLSLETNLSPERAVLLLVVFHVYLFINENSIMGLSGAKDPVFELAKK